MKLNTQASQARKSNPKTVYIIKLCKINSMWSGLKKYEANTGQTKWICKMPCSSKNHWFLPFIPKRTYRQGKMHTKKILARTYLDRVFNFSPSICSLHCLNCIYNLYRKKKKKRCWTLGSSIDKNTHTKKRTQRSARRERTTMTTTGFISEE